MEPVGQWAYNREAGGRCDVTREGNNLVFREYDILSGTWNLGSVRTELPLTPVSDEHGFSWWQDKRDSAVRMRLVGNELIMQKSNVRGAWGHPFSCTRAK
mmetsp:Transcript_15708/g.42823  ORF Transcript_15708/g.42823 Transcript_15708/m.42823 type:complete len:100 (-) Transcript_15708:94-393(-)